MKAAGFMIFWYVRIVTVCMECMRRSLSGCVCDLLYRKKAARMMVRSGVALMSRNWKGGSLWRKLKKGTGQR
jgi:hypothetical protein